MFESRGADGNLGSPLIGRDAERATVGRFVAGVPTGQGCLIITGEAGIGKTRLVREGFREGRQSGFECHGVQCLERDIAVPYALWKELLREFLHSSSRERSFEVLHPHRSVVTEILPEAAELVWLYDATPSVPYRDRRDLRAALIELVRSLGRPRPLLLAVDDLGWADGASLELLGALAMRSDLNLRLLLSYRDTHLQENPALQELLLELSARHSAQLLHLEPLVSAAIEQIVQSGLGDRDVRPEVKGLLCRRAGGNPFFALELARGIPREGARPEDVTPATHSAEDLLAVPESLSAAIRQRLGRLDATARRVLRIGALLGLEFSYPLLREVAQEKEETLLDVIDSTTQDGLLRESVGREYRTTYGFAHPLIQEVLSEEVSRTRGLAIHLRAARWLELEFGAQADEQAATIAYHYLRADERAKAQDWSVKAGEAAARLFARAEAAGHYRNALNAMGPQPEGPAYADVLTRLGDQQQALGELPSAARSFQKASEVWRRLGRRSDAGDCLRRAAHATEGSSEDREALLERARTDLESAEPGRPQVEWYLERADLTHSLGRLNESGTEARRALTLARALHLPAEEVRALDLVALSRPDDQRPEFERLIEEQLTLIATHQLVELRSKVLTNLAIKFYHCDGNLREAGLRLPAIAEAMVQAGLSDENLWSRDVALPWLYVRTGELSQGWKLGTEGIELRTALGRREQSEAATMHALIGTLMGPPERAEQLFATAFEALGRHPMWEDEGVALQFLGRLRLQQGRPKEAVEELLRGRQIYRSMGPTTQQALFYGELLSVLVRACVAAEDPTAATRHTEELRTLAEKFDTPPVWAMFREAQVQARSPGRPTEGDLALLRECADVWDRLGWGYELATTLRDIGELEAARGNGREGRAVLGRASKMFREMGALPDLQNAERIVALLPHEG